MQGLELLISVDLSVLCFPHTRWWYLVVDEGHRLKNASCCLSTKLRAFKAEGRLLLTGAALQRPTMLYRTIAVCELTRLLEHDSLLIPAGTPLHNGVEDLWALLNFLMPNLFGSEETFTQWCDVQSYPCWLDCRGSASHLRGSKRHRNPRAASPSYVPEVRSQLQMARFAGGLMAVIPDGDSEAALLGQEEALLVADRLHLMLRPFMLRRLKEDVASELPQKDCAAPSCIMPGALLTHLNISCWLLQSLSCSSKDDDPDDSV